MSQWASGGVAHSQETAGHSLADKHPVATLQSNSGLKFRSCLTAVEKQEMQPQASDGRVPVMKACLKPFLICLKYMAVRHTIKCLDLHAVLLCSFFRD